MHTFFYIGSVLATFIAFEILLFGLLCGIDVFKVVEGSVRNENSMEKIFLKFYKRFVNIQNFEYYK